MQQIKTFEQLKACITEDLESVKEILVDRLQDLTPFERGRFQGEIIAYSDIIDILRNIIKYSDN